MDDLERIANMNSTDPVLANFEAGVRDGLEKPFDQPAPADEVWKQCPNNGYDILIPNGDFIGAFVHDDTHSKFSRNRCARAVAAHNACRGIPTAALQPGCVAQLREAAMAALHRMTQDGYMPQHTGGEVLTLLRKALAASFAPVENKQ